MHNIYNGEGDYFATWTIIQTLLCTLLAVRNSLLLQMLQMLILKPIMKTVAHTRGLPSNIMQNNSMLAQHYRLDLIWCDS